MWKIRKMLNRNVNYNNMLKNFITDTWEDLSLSKAFKYLKPGHCRILRSKRNNGSSGSKSIHWADLEAQRLWRNSQRYHAHQSHATFRLEPICQANQTGQTGCWAKGYFSFLAMHFWYKFINPKFFVQKLIWRISSQTYFLSIAWPQISGS